MRKFLPFIVSTLGLLGCSDPAQVPDDTKTSLCPKLVAHAIMGSPGFDGANDLAISDDGSRIATVGFLEDPADLGGGMRGTDDGVRDGFVVVHDATGKYQFDAVFSGMGEVDVANAAFTSDGRLVIVGTFQISATFDKLYTSAGDLDMFVMKLDNKGQIVWNRVFGGIYREFARAVEVHGDSGRIVVAGVCGPEIDFGGGVKMGGPQGELFAATFDDNGQLLWDRITTSTAQIRGASMAMDAAGNVVISGLFDGTTDFGGGPRTTGGIDDSFLWNLGPDGAYRWDWVVGGPEIESLWNVDMNPDGSIHALVDIGIGASFSAAETRDVDGDYVIGLSADGKFLWDRHLPASDFFVAWALAATPDGPWVGGQTNGGFELADPPLAGRGSSDAFLTSFTNSGELRSACLIGAAGPEYIKEIVTVGNTLVVSGAFEGATDLGAGVVMGNGNQDGFMAIYTK